MDVAVLSVCLSVYLAFDLERGSFAMVMLSMLKSRWPFFFGFDPSLLSPLRVCPRLEEQ